MKGILTWVSNSIIGPTKAAASYTYTVGSNTAKKVYQIYQHPNEYVDQYWQGWVPAVNVSDPIIFLRKAVDSRNGLIQAATTLGSYTALTAIYAGPVKNVLRSLPLMNNPVMDYASDMIAAMVIEGAWMYINNRYADCTANSKAPVKECAKDLLVSSVVIPGNVSHRLQLNLMISNIFFNLTMSKTVYDEHERIMAMDPRERALYFRYSGCKHDLYERIEPLFMGPANFFAEQLTVFGFDKFLQGVGVPGWLAYLITLPFRIYSDGKGVMDFRLNDMCLNDRREIHNRNLMFYLGVGSSIEFFSELFSWLINLAAGVAPGSGYRDAVRYGVRALLYNWFIMAAILHKNRFPGKPNGVEFEPFYYSRVVMEALAKHSMQIGSKLMNFFNKWFSSQPNKPCNYDEEIAKIMSSRYFQMATQMVLTKDMQDMVSFLRTPPVKYYFDVNIDTFRYLLKTAHTLRKIPFSEQIPGLINYTADLIIASQGFKYFIGIFFARDLEIILYKVENGLTAIRRIQTDEFFNLGARVFDDESLQAANNGDKKVDAPASLPQGPIVLGENTVFMYDHQGQIMAPLIEEYGPDNEYVLPSAPVEGLEDELEKVLRETQAAVQLEIQAAATCAAVVQEKEVLPPSVLPAVQVPEPESVPDEEHFISFIDEYDPKHPPEQPPVNTPTTPSYARLLNLQGVFGAPVASSTRVEAESSSEVHARLEANTSSFGRRLSMCQEG